MCFIAPRTGVIDPEGGTISVKDKKKDPEKNCPDILAKTQNNFKDKIDKLERDIGKNIC